MSVPSATIQKPTKNTSEFFRKEKPLERRGVFFRLGHKLAASVVYLVNRLPFLKDIAHYRRIFLSSEGCVNEI